jgi:hypothetical protein
MISPDDAVALLRAVVPVARELGVMQLAVGELTVALGPLPEPTPVRRPQTDEEAEEEAAAEEARVGYSDLAFAASRAAR